MRIRSSVAAALRSLLPPLVVAAAETPKSGGTLTYVIPVEVPPSFDAHRETTFATIHSAAPFTAC
jgi:peptide/nickel transport system substrate-binding protein